METSQPVLCCRFSIFPLHSPLWQGDTVRALKAAKAERAAIDEAIKKLQGLKLELESATKAYMAHADVSKGDSSINREKFRQDVNNALERR